MEGLTSEQEEGGDESEQGANLDLYAQEVSQHASVFQQNVCQSLRWSRISKVPPKCCCSKCFTKAFCFCYTLLRSDLATAIMHHIPINDKVIVIATIGAPIRLSKNIW